MNAREAAGRFGGLTIYGLAVEYAKSKVGSRHRTDVVAELENRSAEIERLRERGAWQPIETAPKDGTPILIFDPTQGGQETLQVKEGGQVFRYDDKRFAIGYWRVWKTGGEWMWGNRNSGEVSPTHWMRLPEPPEAKLAEGRKG